MSRRSPRRVTDFADHRRVTDFADHIDNSQRAISNAKKATLATGEVSCPEPLSRWLWNETSVTEFREEALQSGFIQGLKKRSLNPEGFGGYMIQDASYCYWAKENIETAAKRATDPNIKTFLNDRTDEYKKYYEELFKTWHIDNPACVRLSQSCQDYVNHEKNVATSYDSIYMIIALIPCAKLWPWLGQQIGAGERNFGVYTDWVNINLYPNESGVWKYEDIIDEAQLAGHINPDLALAVYKGSMKGEAGFFSSINTVFQ